MITAMSSAGLLQASVEERVRAQREGSGTAGSAPARAEAPAAEVHVRHLEGELQRVLGTAVRIRVGSNRSGRIEIPFYNAEDFDRVLEALLGAEAQQA